MGTNHIPLSAASSCSFMSKHVGPCACGSIWIPLVERFPLHNLLYRACCARFRAGRADSSSHLWLHLLLHVHGSFLLVGSTLLVPWSTLLVRSPLHVHGLWCCCLHVIPSQVPALWTWTDTEIQCLPIKFHRMLPSPSGGAGELGCAVTPLGRL